MARYNSFYLKENKYTFDILLSSKLPYKCISDIYYQENKYLFYHSNRNTNSSLVGIIKKMLNTSLNLQKKNLFVEIGNLKNNEVYLSN